MTTTYRTHDGRTLEQAASDLVAREVHLCLSSMVSTLAANWDVDHVNKGMNELHAQAQELCAPVLEWEEAVICENFQVRHDHLGFYVCSDDEAEHEEAGNASVGFDGRHHAPTIEAAAQEWCEAEAVDPYERAVFEHWAVSQWLGEQLRAKGERVDDDFAGLIVWARTTTGQVIHADHVIEQITQELHLGNEI